MDKETIDEILACLPQGKTRFDYFHDRYALMLLAWKAGEGISVSELKKSHYARLLQKSVIKKLLAQMGGGQISASEFAFVWNEPARPFLLSLDTWDGSDRWGQTSRRGKNLVLQMNFSNQHRSVFQRLIKPQVTDLYLYCGHPVKNPHTDKNYRDTMAWARIDLDLFRGEALIEEVQNDWLRMAIWDYRCGLRRASQEKTPLRLADCNLAQLQQYHDEVLQPYLKIWDEAMLAAALWFLRCEIGINRIWYHDYETGAALKRINYTRPPRSLYTDLPKKFCFQQTDSTPEFLLQDREFYKRHRKLENPQWFYLEV